VFMFDVEHALDLNLAINSGVDPEKNFFISQPDHGEQTFDIIENVLKARDKSFMIVDSIAALIPKTVLERGFDDSVQPGTQARMMSQALQKLTPLFSKTESIIIFINQLRNKIGTMSFGDPSVTPGGKALKYYASVRIKVQNAQQILSKEEKIGHTALIKVEKNKVAIPFKDARIKIFYGTGFSATSDILNLAIANKIVSKSGAWFDYEEEHLGQGELNTIIKLYNNKELYNTIKKKVLDAHNITCSYDNIYNDYSLAIDSKFSNSDFGDLNDSEEPILGEES
jgi:recombination protein RecA